MLVPLPTATADVLIIGGGPAGSTAATLLARQGRRVVMLEKARHPRFHIGESLLPANGPLFDQLGVRAEVERMGMAKWGVEFVSPQHSHTQYVEFGDAWDKSMPYAWQVRRSELDEMLFRNAAAAGAMAIEGCRVTGVTFEADGAQVSARLDDGEERHWRARFVLDASGRDTFLANQFNLKRRNERHNSAALFAHYRGAQRLDGKREGNISIFWFAHGWFWFIPLADGTTSVGAVCWPYYLKTRQGRPLPQFLADTIALAPALAERLKGAELVEGTAHATGNYSYGSRTCGGANYLLLGDAYAFVDPVFSSGVYLAMHSAFAAVDVVGAELDRDARRAAVARKRFGAVMAQGPRDFSWFIFRMTNPALRGLFMHPRNLLRVQEAVLTLLAGDIFGRTPFRRSLNIFKGFYYVKSLFNWRTGLKHWRMRREIARQFGSIEGETVMKT